jgi:hypothetical protein
VEQTLDVCSRIAQYDTDALRASFSAKVFSERLMTAYATSASFGVFSADKVTRDVEEYPWPLDVALLNHRDCRS